MHYSTTYNSPIGIITLGSDGEKLVGLWNEGQKYHGESITGKMIANDSLNIFIQTKKWLDMYFAGNNPNISDLPLAPIGTAFRQNVWRILCEIPYGKVVTYGDIASELYSNISNSRKYSRAIGGAVGHNPISIIIPCHRVIGSTGNLTGYAGGVDKKTFLLELEGVNL
jgi:methylated-DNA-[protein]-cysteine S-methyltransferase